MWTYAGWVHAQGKGWIKGYKLSPKFFQKKIKKSSSHIKPHYEEVENCKKVPVN
jgi:hypothetical protein